MIEILDIGISNVVAYRLEGKITEAEMKSIMALFRKKIQQGEKINIYQEIVSFGGVEMDAMVEKFKFFLDVGISHFDKIAVISSKKWTQNLIQLEDRLFKGLNMKGFSTAEKDKALAFLKQ
jgi:hypothetical protein